MHSNTCVPIPMAPSVYSNCSTTVLRTGADFLHSQHRCCRAWARPTPHMAWPGPWAFSARCGRGRRCSFGCVWPTGLECNVCASRSAGRLAFPCFTKLSTPESTAASCMHRLHCLTQCQPICLLLVLRSSPAPRQRTRLPVCAPCSRCSAATASCTRVCTSITSRPAHESGLRCVGRLGRHGGEGVQTCVRPVSQGCCKALHSMSHLRTSGRRY